MLKKYFSVNALNILIAILLIELVFNLTLKTRVLNDQVLTNSMAERMTMDEINTLLITFKSNAFLLIFFSLLQPLIEILLTAICINTGTLLLKIQLSFKDILEVVVKAFFVFSLTRIIFILAFFFINVERVEDLNVVSFWSLSDWIDLTSLPTWVIYPLQYINVFQMAFVLLLAYGLNMLKVRGFNRWIGLVLSTYGIGLIILILMISFLTAL